ncbi:MAG: alpha/beta fold hydrolase [Pirellulales bacterium]|jgi:pimeloyl-ACP methyl ester carboxylesterase|nr:alpha/beta fold hydrolase [Thermoguttaceae bacterium]MDD4787531.1 alpha/beta fold hydrolase [Pirellulales bacterium]MDI9443983.1 alpha/beta fold hydrolase [Planctomycetota bacterium]NLY99397.1 alpha/beta fold hydrolase [Pirellulaceae bacterium]
MNVLLRHRLLPYAAPVLCAAALGAASAAEPPDRMRSDPPLIVSSWDDLIEGVKTREDWQARRHVLRQRYLELIRDEQKPKKPPLELEIHETVDIEGVYRRQLISYNVEQDERAHAYLGIPLKPHGAAAGDAPDKFPAIVALHGTTAQGKEQTAGLSGNPDKAWLDQLCRRGYVVIAPDHFVAGHRIPPEGAYDTARFYQKHPEWTAVGKFTYEHAIAIDLLQSLPEVDPDRIGTLGHSLGGHGAYYLAAYDERVKAAVCNCGGAFFRHNPDVLNSARDRWYVYFKHLRPGLLEGRLPPIDRHEIIALVAPRPFMDLSGLNDGNGLVQRQRVLALLRIMDVYELEKAPQNFAFYVHGRGHSVAHESRELIFGWMDVHLKPPSVTQTHLLSADEPGTDDPVQ